MKKLTKNNIKRIGSKISEESTLYFQHRGRIYFFDSHIHRNYADNKAFIHLNRVPINEEPISFNLDNRDNILISTPPVHFKIMDIVSTPDGNVYFTDVINHSIWKITFDAYQEKAELSRFAGTLHGGFADGEGLRASFYGPTSLSYDAQSNLYVADTGNHAIRKITPEGRVSTLYKAPNH